MKPLQKEESQEAFEIYGQMQAEGLSVDTVTFLSILKACAYIAALETGKKIHAQVCRLGFETCAIVANTLVDDTLIMARLKLCLVC